MLPNLPNCFCCNQQNRQNPHSPPTLSYGDTFCMQSPNIILTEEERHQPNLESNHNLPVDQSIINEMVLITFPAASNLCSKHNKPQDLICSSERKKICIDCLDECLRRRHKIKARKVVEADADKKKRAFQSFVETFDSKYDEIYKLLNDDQDILLKEVESHLVLFQTEAEKTKDGIRSAVEKYFEAQKKTADDSKIQDYNLKAQAYDLVQVLDRKSFDDQFFIALYTCTSSLVISYQKPPIEVAIKILSNHVEALRIELTTFLTKIPLLLETCGRIENSKIEEDEVLNHGKSEFIDNGEAKMPKIETEEDYLRTISLLYAEIEESNRLILSFKNQQRETASLLNDQEKLKTINKVTLQINKSKEWKEAIGCLQWIWNKFDKVINLKIDFSFKTQAKEILEALTEESNIWATRYLTEFTVDLSSTNIEDKHTIQLYEKAISKMVNIEKLEIVLENTKITDTSVKEFAENTLPNLASLKDFRFYVDSTKVTDEAMEKLLTCIHNRKENLTGLALGFDETAITDKTIENMAKNISPLASNLIKLDLSANKTSIEDDGLRMLTESLDSKLSNLKEFALDLGCTRVSNEGFKVFVQRTLPQMISLEVFELFLNEQKNITNQTTRSIAQSLQPLGNLKKICLELGGTEINGKTLVDIEQSTLNNKLALETFELYVAETKIQAQDINNFLKKIGENQTFQNLHKLSFCFSLLNVTDKSCELLAKPLQLGMNNLQTLHLLLGKTKITDLGLISLSNGLNQTLQRTNLGEFHLYLDSTEVTDKGLKVFSNQVVRSLVGVKSFELYLTFLKGVTDSGVEVLFEGLSAVGSSLRKIALSLYATGITDSCMKALSRALRNVKPLNLESFDLSIGRNQNITDESLGCLWILAPILYNLKSFLLNVEGTNIDKEGVEVLKQYWLQGSNALEKLEIEVGNDGNL